MPPKKKEKKKSLKEKRREEEKLKISRTLRELLNNYVLKCNKEQSLTYPPFQDHIQNCRDGGTHLTKMILAELPSENDLVVKLAPALAAIRSIRYTHIKEIFVWDIHVKYEDIAALSRFIQQPAYSLTYLEMVDCKIDSFSLGRFAECLSMPHLTTLVLDFNGFGDEGCVQLCSGLEGNSTLIKLSLKFCGLTAVSGVCLGKTISETAISELYLDGNKLECEGLIEVLQMVVDRAEQESIERNQVKEDGYEGQDAGSRNFLGIKTGVSALRGDSATSRKSAPGSRPISPAPGKQSPLASKKKKKKGKKKKPIAKSPPKVGPWLTKLHVMDNGIDSHGIASKFAPVLCMRLVKRWIATAADLLELDIDDNLIGDMGGREILHGLQERSEAGLSKMTVWITHRIQPDTFNKVLALGTAGKKKPKKKGKRGKKRV